MARALSLGLSVMLFLLLAAPVASAEDLEDLSTWTLTGNRDGIQSYQRSIEGSDLLAFRGEAVIDAPIDRVLSVVLDATRVTEWIPGISESVVLGWPIPQREYIQYTRFDAPWPVSDRVFVSTVAFEVDPETHRATLAYTELDRELDKPGAIQGSAGGSYYVMTPVDRNLRTHFVGVSVADPKGSIPVWLVNWMGRFWAYDTLTQLRAQVRRQDIEILELVKPFYVGLRGSRSIPASAAAAR